MLWTETTGPLPNDLGSAVNIQGVDTLSGTTFPVAADGGINLAPRIKAGLVLWTRGYQPSQGIWITRVVDARARAAVADPSLPPLAVQPVPETGRSLAGPFKGFWEAHGGLPVFGYPLTEEYPARAAIGAPIVTVQYLERQRFEYHPDLAGTPYEILLGRLGAEAAERRGLRGHWAFQPLPGELPERADCRYLAAARHCLRGSFRQYWETHGLEIGDAGVSEREALALFGYPISEEFVEEETGLIVQYFERARFEWHPDKLPPHQVLLTRLGAVARGEYPVPPGGAT